MTDQKTYSVLSTLLCNGVTYSPDVEGKDTVDMDPDKAAPLIALKVLADHDSAAVEETIDLPNFDLVAELCELMSEGVSIPFMNIIHINKLLSQPTTGSDVHEALKSIKVGDNGPDKFDLVAELKALIKGGKPVDEMSMDNLNPLLSQKVKRAEVTAALDKIKSADGN